MSSTDKRGRELVRELELSLGNRVRKAPNSSYDWLISSNMGEIHAEVKAAAPGKGGWYAINGVRALRNLIQDPLYRLYFVALGPPPIVLRCKPAFLWILMGWKLDVNVPRDLESLEANLTDLQSRTKMPLDCRVQFHPPGGLETVIIIALARMKMKDPEIRASVDGIWELKGDCWQSKWEVHDA